MDVQDGGSLWLPLVLPTLSTAEVVDPYAPTIDVLEPPLVGFCWLLDSRESDSDDRASASGLRRKGLESCRWSCGCPPSSSPCRLPKRRLSLSLGEDSLLLVLRLPGRLILPGREEWRVSGRKDDGGVCEPADVLCPPPPPPPGDRRRCIICRALTSRDDVCGEGEEGGGTSEESRDDASGGHTGRPSYDEYEDMFS